MLCPKCNSVNPPEAKFCGKCGEKLVQSVSPPTPPVPPIPTPTEESVSDGLKIGIAVGSVIIPLLGIIMGAIYMKKPGLAKKKAGKLWLFIGLGATVFWCLYTLGSNHSNNYPSY